ncbi:MAG: phosphoribosylamine--glycine ligase [Proteobacteria bacterium]|nr:phosphoribosylamine--glycine ligase [Pseudomonadota bacterium]
MKVLIVGGGGREHALCWKIKQSILVKEIFCAPGNGGTALIAQNVPIKAEDVRGIVDFAKETKIDLVVIGPEAPLNLGLVDMLQKEGIMAFGPSKNSALLEGSKVFAKNIMRKYNIPTADFEVFDNPDLAKKYLLDKKAPIVVKADGLAAGKGVYVCKTTEEALNAIDDIMVKKIFGSAGDRLVIEECLEGEEASFLVFTDGKTVLPMDSSQDHKRVFDNDEGPNTGGMGAYSPAPVVTKEVFDKVMEKIIYPTIMGMEKEGCPFKGVLYAGLMIKDGEPYVLEFNTRFGDPEAQPLLMRIKNDIVPVLMGCIDGKLENEYLLWEQKHSVCVVIASGGYPGEYKKGYEIKGLDEIDNDEVYVFHAGTKLVDGKIYTDGGRVLGVTALGDTIKSAIDNAYDAVSKICFEGMHYRKDIGRRALARGDR